MAGYFSPCALPPDVRSCEVEIMNRHLALILKANQRSPELAHDEVPCVSDMDIIFPQALLMDAGSATFKAIKSGDIVGILVGLVALAYTALSVLAYQEQELVDQKIGVQEYQMLAIMRLLSGKIHQCSSGEAMHYSELYHACVSLVTGFLNADFDKAFLAYHNWYETSRDSGDAPGSLRDLHQRKLPDLEDCLYE
jgi:hypothetical protein